MKEKILAGSHFQGHDAGIQRDSANQLCHQAGAILGAGIQPGGARQVGDCLTRFLQFQYVSMCWKMPTICTADVNCQVATVAVGVPISHKQVLS